MAINDNTVAPQLDALYKRPRNNPRPLPAEAIDNADLDAAPENTTVFKTELYDEDADMTIDEAQATLGEPAHVGSKIPSPEEGRTDNPEGQPTAGKKHK